jgi:hypothetical protein
MAEFHDQQDIGRGRDQDYSREEYRFKSGIIESKKAAPNLIDLINQYDFSQSCKIVLSEIISVNFDSNAMLARNENTLMRQLKLKIALNLAVVQMDESDTANPGLLNVMQSIEDAFADIVSRSIGGKERDQIAKSESVQTSNYTGLSQPEQPRGFNLPKFGGR